ncbi:hypothetical protein HYPSUDRAFT_70264 [Hypholoma sublateritium FD-334 SS-4]|uniref:Uncharacterized protein n=1 Tax=Hypholoma sublateritium (strain FD-334 SS-4) TaxID=945553 RepID=A0A0D2KTM8_HYPSF|nr:hypothetical protein HYPSUDRAFT_70264 [Hypholoma sublateritium FD-334 SS-4]
MDQHTASISDLESTGPTLDIWPFEVPNAIASGETEVQCTKTAASIMTFKTTDIILNNLEHLVQGKNVEEKDWSRFITFCIRLWLFCIVFSVILMPVIIYSSLPDFPTIAIVSVAFALVGANTASVLIYCHWSLVNPSPSHASKYLRWMFSPLFGFQITAMLFSLPLWTFIYACLIFCLKWAKFLYT